MMASQAGGGSQEFAGDFPPNPFREGGAADADEFYDHPLGDGGGTDASSGQDMFVPNVPDPSFAAQASLQGSIQPPAPPVQPSQEPQTRWQMLMGCMSMENLRSYFDVDTSDVRKRIIGSVTYVNTPGGFRYNVLGVNAPALVETDDSNTTQTKKVPGPDLYGPFWVSLTLVFLVAVTSNMSVYLHSDSKSDIEYDISHLIRATSIFFFYTFGLPGMLFLTLKCGAVQGLTFIELVALYGYSLVPFFPATFLCLMPWAIVHWIALGISTTLSGMLILRNVSGPILESDPSPSHQKAGPILMFIVGIHIIFYFVLKFTFYHHRKF